MTVCIALVCNNGEAIVLASDRMVTGINPPIEFEHEKKKISPITKKCVALTAGNAVAQTELLTNAKNNITENDDLTIREITSKIAESYDSERKRILNELIFRPRGFTQDEFYRDHIKKLPDALIAMIDRDVFTFNYNLGIIVGGIDKNGAHIYSIMNPGTIQCFDSIGFHAIGIGETHALGTLILNKIGPSCELNKGIYFAYEAKRNAQVAPGVGEETDIDIITKDGIRIIDNKTIVKLAEIFNDKYMERSKSFTEKLSSLKI